MVVGFPFFNPRLILLFLCPPSLRLVALLFHLSVCFSRCRCCAADGRDCLVLLIWQVSLPSCYLCATVRVRACVRACMHACASVRAKKRQLPRTHNAHTRSHVNPFTPASSGRIDFYLMRLDLILLARCFCSETQQRVLSSRRCKTKSLTRCSPRRGHICVLLPSYITTLFTSWAANHRCNFHHPCEVARTSLPWYIHFMIWLICWASAHPYWLR